MKNKAVMVMTLVIVSVMMAGGKVEAKINTSMFQESEIRIDEDTNINVTAAEVVKEGILAENGAFIPFEDSLQASYSWEVVTYNIQDNDCLWKIGKQYGIDLEELIQLNSQIKNTDLVYPGQIINLYKICLGYEASVQE